MKIFQGHIVNKNCLALFFITTSLFFNNKIWADSGYEGDSLSPVRSFDYNYIHTYVPDTSYEVVADRIQCIETEIPLILNDKVKAFVDLFVMKDPAYIKHALKKRNLYFSIFEEYLKVYELPEELKYLAIVESGLKPQAVSRAGAVGLWQFMPRTGRIYDMHESFFIDERMDPHKSTEAACKYLKYLYRQFNDWELALAAYNAGPGSVRKAIRKSGEKKSFWEIYEHLPRETRSYVPQFVAMVYAMHYAFEHKIFQEEKEYAIKFDTIHVSQFIHLQTLANQLGVCLEDLQKLNPELKRNAVPGDAKSYPLKIPIDTYDFITAHRTSILDSASKVGKEELEYLARNEVGSTYGREKIRHKVKRGDVLGKIARKYHVRIADLRAWNKLRGNIIRIGQPLAVWVKTDAFSQAPEDKQLAQTNDKVAIPSGKKIHYVQPGDTLWDIARQYPDITIEKIKKMNKLKSNKIKPGQKLVVG